MNRSPTYLQASLWEAEADGPLGHDSALGVEEVAGRAVDPGRHVDGQNIGRVLRRPVRKSQ